MAINTEINQGRMLKLEKINFYNKLGKILLSKPMQKSLQMSYGNSLSPFNVFRIPTQRKLRKPLCKGLFIWFCIKKKENLSFSIDDKQFCYSLEEITKMDDDQLETLFDNINEYQKHERKWIDYFLDEDEKRILNKLKKKASPWHDLYIEFYEYLAIREYNNIEDEIDHYPEIDGQMEVLMKISEMFMDIKDIKRATCTTECKSPEEAKERILPFVKEVSTKPGKYRWKRNVPKTDEIQKLLKPYTIEDLFNAGFFDYKDINTCRSSLSQKQNNYQNKLKY